MFRNICPATACAILALTTTTSAFQCTSSFFEALLPPTATITSVESISNGSTYQVPTADIAYPTSPSNLQALCAVEVNVTSSPTSAYTFGLFLPDNWNKRFLAVGNGGFAGGINWLDMGAGVGYGFASMSTNTGHNSNSSDVTWALNNEETKIDWGYRAMHGSITIAKDIVKGYYNCAPKYSYYSGCSTGGRQGLRDIQLYPEDFDGVLAGAPAWWTSHLQTWTVKLALFNLPTTAAHHIPEALFPVIAAEALKQCDPQDGLVDNIISDPRRCDFVPETLLCASNVTNGTAAGCLTAPQISTLYHIYNDYVETNDTLIFPGFNVGSEAQWYVLLGGEAPSNIGTEYVQDFLLNDPDWSFYDFNGTIVELADEIQPGNATAYDFNLAPFHARGGKLLQYHGEADALISTDSSIYFYKQVLTTLKAEGIELDDWYRFFLVPGMQHCLGTPTDVNAPWYFAGANQAGTLNSAVFGVPGFRDSRHDALLALMAWREKGIAPEEIIATKWNNDTTQDVVSRQRPLCPFPKRAIYSGHGDPDVANNWNCELLYNPNATYAQPTIVL